ncbi:MAG: LysR family transcriptional regulator [Desulfatiglandaceae bacterium]
MIGEMGGDFFQWLRGFFFVAKRGSVTLAAKEMGRNQPTISHQIKCLENELGVALFDRSGGRMELTVEGRNLLDKTISLFEIVMEMKEEVRADRLEKEGTISICTTHAVVHYFLPAPISTFKIDHPSVNFHIEGGGVDMIVKNVEAAEVDFGIASINSVPQTLTYWKLFETKLMLIAPKGNDFFQSSSPSLEEIAKAPFISFPRSSTITPLVAGKFAERGLVLNETFTLNNYETVKKFVAMGAGVAILDDYAVNEGNEHKIEVYGLGDFFPIREYGVVLRKRKYLPPCAKAFLERLKFLSSTSSS